MTAYKSHFACFECRKTFKRRLLGDFNRHKKTQSKEAKCPECRNLMADMGKDFEAPKKDSIKQWEHIKSLYSVGITFHSCGCTGPGYIPNTKESLIALFQELLRGYYRNLDFWRQRIEPNNEREADREKSKQWEFIGKIPGELQPKRGWVSNEDAKNYWIGRVKEIEQRLNSLTADHSQLRQTSTSC